MMEDGRNPDQAETDISTIFQRAGDLFAAGKYHDAITGFRTVAELDPSLGEAHFNLAMALKATDQTDEALAAFQKATDASPDWADAWLTRGRLLWEMKRLEEASEHFLKVVALSPTDGDAHFLLGNIELEQGNLEEATPHFEAALKFGGPGAEIHNNIGKVHEVMGRHDEAVEAYRRSLAINPDHFLAMVNLAQLQVGLRQNEEAEALFRKALAHSPDNAEVNNALGDLLQLQNRHDEVVLLCNDALSSHPDDANIVNRMAFSLAVLRRHVEAINQYEKLIKLRPESPAVLINYASLMQMADRFDEGLVLLRKAIELDPNFSRVYPLLVHAMLRQCEWTNIGALLDRVIAKTRSEMAEGKAISAPPFALLGMPVPLDIRLAVSRQAAEAAASRVSLGSAEFKYRNNPDRPLRIGYFSPDFRGHSVGTTFKDLIAAHDRERFEWTAYHISRSADDVYTEYFRDNFDHFVDLRGTSHQDAAHRINADGIDILVDLAGHTGSARFEVLAQKPAPIQVHFLGYGATTGADYMDYLITDEDVMSAESAAFCSEALAYVPDTFMPASRHQIPKHDNSREDYGLPEDGIVFANFNSHYKFDAEMFGIWMRILRKTPGSVLWLVHGSDRSDANLRREAETRGVTGERLIFAPRCGHEEHLARHTVADLGFDNHLHAGGVTTIDSLWAGLPVLTNRGPYPNSRTGVGILKAIGLPELISEKLADYDRMALSLTSTPGKLAELKARLMETRETSDLFNMHKFARHLENAYDRMWEIRQKGGSPTTFHVKRGD
jgi:predicted O-linked N-acetylglucosamine transferase (SPINDLY family)